MPRKGMNVKQFNAFMSRCDSSLPIRYVTPTIHPKFKQIVAITIHTGTESKEFTITNNPDENFDLNHEVHAYLNSLSIKEKNDGSNL